MQAVCVFCGASKGARLAYHEAAQTLGQVLAEQKIRLVWGGGHVGLMGVVADAVHAAGGHSLGVIPGFMAQRELAHPNASEMLEVDSMHERKALMAERADAFIALPGGFGTLDELFEILTWAQLHLHQKPIGLLNVAGFYDPLLAMLRHMVAEGFVRSADLNLLCVAATVPQLLDQLRSYQPAGGDWLEKTGLKLA